MLFLKLRIFNSLIELNKNVCQTDYVCYFIESTLQIPQVTILWESCLIVYNRGKKAF